MRALKKDLTGQRFGRLTVLERAPNQNGRVAYLCRCQCGTELTVLGQNLTNGCSKSCGCLNHELAAQRMKKQATTHGESKTRLYREWKRIKKVCRNPNDPHYHHYGGRGITYAPEWETFEPFKAWAMAAGYRDDLEIDRIDNNGNYEPSNCRWTDRKTNVRNRRNSFRLTLGGETKTAAEWAEITGLPLTCLSRRKCLGWNDERILTTPKRGAA